MRDYSTPKYYTDRVIPQAPDEVAMVEPEEPSWGETFYAILEKENLAYGLATSASETEYPYNADYHPYKDPENKGYEMYEDLAEMGSAEEAAQWRSNIQREKDNNEIIANSGTFAHVSAEVANGVISLENFIPFIGPARRTYKSAQIAEGAVKGGASLGAIEVGREVVLHQTQETRTLDESFERVIGATVIGGVLGGAIGSFMSKRQYEEVLDLVEEDFRGPLKPIDTGTGDTGRSVGAAAQLGRDAEETKTIFSGIGEVAALLRLNPTMSLSSSPFKATREIFQGLVENNLLTKGNKAGVASDYAAETVAKLKRADMVPVIKFGNEQYKKMRQSGVSMSRSDFNKKVHKAMDYNDTHRIPEVQATAQRARKVYDQRTKEAVEAGMLDEKFIDPKWLAKHRSYTHRMWNTDHIRSQPTKFKTIVFNWLKDRKSQGADEDLTDADLWTIAEDIKRHITSGEADIEMGNVKRGEFSGATASPTKARTLTIPNKLVRDFVEQDFETVMTRYNSQMSADIALKEKFGDVTLKDAYETLLEEANPKIKAAFDAGDFKLERKLERRLLADKENLLAMRDRLRGVYGAPADKNDWLYRSGRFLRNLNFTSMLGQMQISAIPDLGGMVLKNGMGNTLAGMMKTLARSDISKIQTKELQEIGVGIDMTIGDRAKAFADVNDPFGGGTMIERGAEALSSKMGKLSLMDQWNTATKIMAGASVQNRMIRDIHKLADGKKLSQSDIESLAMQGIDAKNAPEMSQLLKDHGLSERGVHVANTDLWKTNPELAQVFNAGVLKTVDSMIVTPGIGDTPKFMSSGVGRVVAQFKTFPMATISRTSVPAAQRRNVAVLNGAMVMIGLGLLSHYIKAAIKGDLDEVEKQNAQTLAFHSFGWSGLGGIFTEGFNIIDKVAGARISESMGITHSAKTGKFAARSVVGSTMGPTFSTLQNAFGAGSDVVDAISGEDYGADEVKGLKKMLPYNNLWYLNAMFHNYYEDK